MVSYSDGGVQTVSMLHTVSDTHRATPGAKLCCARQCCLVGIPSSSQSSRLHFMPGTTKLLAHKSAWCGSYHVHHTHISRLATAGTKRPCPCQSSPQARQLQSSLSTLWVLDTTATQVTCNQVNSTAQSDNHNSSAEARRGQSSVPT
jgi:hypothetical protein